MKKSKNTFVMFYGISPTKFFKLLEELSVSEEARDIIANLSYIGYKNRDECLKDLLLQKVQEKAKP